MAYYPSTYDSSGFLFDPASAGVSHSDAYFPAGGYPSVLDEGLHYGAWVPPSAAVVEPHFAEDFGPWPPNPPPPPAPPAFSAANFGGAFSLVPPATNPPPPARTDPTRLFSCPTCHKHYCRKSTLKAHMRQHMGQRPFTCQICGKCFSQAANLTAHKRVHTGEKPFECPICLRPFSQSSSLVTHKRFSARDPQGKDPSFQDAHRRATVPLSALRQGLHRQLDPHEAPPDTHGTETVRLPAVHDALHAVRKPPPPHEDAPSRGKWSRRAAPRSALRPQEVVPTRSLSRLFSELINYGVLVCILSDGLSVGTQTQASGHSRFLRDPFGVHETA
uniref:Protein krueppel n=1 Tax=Steinernema glaseri TaxID=37863 RepID=A0A1I7YBB7_9BILA